MDIENIYYHGRIKVPYKWYVGETGSRFLVELRDNKELWGKQCPKCNTVYIPPSKTCWECYTPTEKWVKLKNTGVVESFTVAHYSEGVAPKDVPIIYGLIKIDGADGSLIHFIGDVDPDKVSVGMRVKAVFAEERTGSILDIKHFVPSEE